MSAAKRPAQEPAASASSWCSAARAPPRPLPIALVLLESYGALQLLPPQQLSMSPPAHQQEGRQSDHGHEVHQNEHRSPFAELADLESVDADQAVKRLNAAAGCSKMSEAECVVQLRRTCIGLLDDAALCVLLTAFCGCSNPEPEHALLSAIAAVALAPRISALKNPASRQLFSAISCVIKVHPVVFTQLSFLLMKGTIGGPQCETLTRCIKESLSPACAIDFLTQLVGQFVSGDLVLNESACTVINEVFSVHSAFPAASVSALVTCMDVVSEQLASSIKFAKAILTILNKCQNQKEIVVTNKELFEKMGLSNKTPLAGAILSKIKNLK